MTLVGRTWSKWVRVRRDRLNDRPDKRDWIPDQYRWIDEHAPGKSFVDIGGLFMRGGDIAFAAEAAGASAVTCFDVGDPDLPAGGDKTFAEKREERGSSIRFVQGDLEDPDSVAEIGPHDIVWCTGVIYHTPNPVKQLMQLRALTLELLYLGTLTIPDLPGFPNACIYYPYLPNDDRAPYAAGPDWDDRVPKGLLGIGEAIDEAPMRGYGNCWWGISRSALRAMLCSARFEVVEERRIFPAPYLSEIVARPIDADPMMPPHDYFRKRGRLRERTGERLPFESYYDDLRAGRIPEID